MPLGSVLVRLCIAPPAAWAAFHLFRLFYERVGEPMWRRVLLGPRPYESLNPEADRFIEGNWQSVQVASYLVALLAAVAVFFV